MKAIEKVKKTPELIAYYKKVGVFLKNNPKIKSRKLALGYEVNIGTIPNELVEEWINIVNNK
jgi:hypothetical protein